MPKSTARVVTVITAFEARELLMEGFAALGLHSYSVFQVEGMGAHGVKRSGFTATKNLSYVIVTSEAKAEGLLEWVDRELLPHHPSIAYSTDAVAVAASPL